jgi:hypothetical protein
MSVSVVGSTTRGSAGGALVGGGGLPLPGEGWVGERESEQLYPPTDAESTSASATARGERRQ